MNRHLLAAIAGLAASLAAGSLVLVWQRQQLRTLPSAELARRTEAPASSPDFSAAQALAAWQQIIRPAEPFSEAAVSAHLMLQTLDAPACRAAAEAALAWPEAEREAALGDILTRWLSLEPEATMTWALPHFPTDGPIITQLGIAWAWRDPAALVAWYEQGLDLPQKALREKIQELDVAQWLANSDAHWFGRFIGRELIPDPKRWRRDNSFLLRESLTTPEAAAALAAGLTESKAALQETFGASEERFKTGLLESLREAWLRVDPDGWARWAEAHPGLARLARTVAGDGVTFFYLRADAFAANRWLESVPQEQQPAEMGKIIANWAASDLEAAGAWLAAQVVQGGGEKTWAAAEAFAKQAAAVDPDAAFQWAATIGDPARRARAERQTFLRWHDADPAAAMAWLEHSGWDEAQQTAVREMAAVQLAP